MSQSNFLVSKLSAVALMIVLAGCDHDQGSSIDEEGAVRTPADGGGLVTTSGPPTCIGTMASFTLGLRDDLAAALAPEQRDRNNDPAVDGITVTPGYGVDLAILTTGFVVDHRVPELARPADPTLTFGGWISISSGRDPLAMRAAEQMWAALAGASETIQARTESSSTTRTTPGGRVACGRQTTAGGTVAVHCVLTGFLYLEAAERPCQ